jgi:hypothetical protein
MTLKITPTFGAAALGIVVLLTLFTIPRAFGADGVIKTNVAFPFQVKSETLPAGEYQFSIDRETEMVSILGPKGSGGMIPILTALAAAPHSDATDAHIVFDKVGTTYTLSELWEPGADGVLVYATKGKHEHHVLRVKR